MTLANQFLWQFAEMREARHESQEINEVRPRPSAVAHENFHLPWRSRLYLSKPAQTAATHYGDAQPIRITRSSAFFSGQRTRRFWTSRRHPEVILRPPARASSCLDKL